MRLLFTRGVTLEFADRSIALKQLEDVAERGTRFPLIVYGPEGCGKTALLKQAIILLEEHGYNCILVDPLESRIDLAVYTSNSIRGILSEFLHTLLGDAAQIAELAFRLAHLALERLRKPRLAILLDDLFQAVGVEHAELYVKRLLNLIEYPPHDYESIVVIVTSSEGVSRERLGRHNWAEIRMMWNLPRSGFEELYRQLPGVKPPVDRAWRWTGGNPRMLARLYERRWNVDIVVDELVEERSVWMIAERLRNSEAKVLRRALEDPDALLESEDLLSKLVSLNLVALLPQRHAHLWLDKPPPEHDPELGVGKRVAWQTPLHREAVRKVLKSV